MKNQNKIILYFIFTFIFTIILPYANNSKIEDVITSLREIAYSYYMRGESIQANINKDHFFSPEEATSQNINYLVSTSFTTTVYQELLNIVVPYSPADLLLYAKNNLTNPEVFAYADKYEEILNMRIYDPENEKKYKLVENPSFEYILSLIKIGDLLVHSGHAFIVYDLIKDEKESVIDAIIIESTVNGKHINSKIQKQSIYLPNGQYFSSSGCGLFWRSQLNTDLEEGLLEGTIGINKLSKIYYWKNIDTFYKAPEYAILRFINSDANQNAILNYKNIYSYWKGNFSDCDPIELSDKNKDRIRFKHLYIEKTVNKINNNIVQLGESLIYKIVIKNMGKTNYADDLIVTEYLSSFVTYKSRKENKKIVSFKEDKNNRQLIWNLGKLKKGDEFIINYTVNVSNGNAKDLIESKGFVANISSSTIFNVIGNNLKKEQMNLIKNSYDALKKKFNGKILINEIYKKAFNIDIQFDKFNIKELIINSNLSSTSVDTLNLNKTNPFSEAVLNKYWSSLASINFSYIKGGEEVTIYNLKNFEYFISSEYNLRREDYIFKETLKTGDILIYTNYHDIEYTLENEKLDKKNITNENGEYAYVYIDGKGFVGVNYGDDGKPNTLDDRNEFNYKYYKDNNLSLYLSTEEVSEEFFESDILQTLFIKDYYAILRPSLCFDFPYTPEKNKSKKSYGLIIFFIILIIIIVLIGVYVLLKFLKLKKQGKEFNFKNLKEQPLLG